MMNGSESGDMDCRGSYFEDGILVLLFLFLVEVQVSFSSQRFKMFWNTLAFSCDRRYDLMWRGITDGVYGNECLVI